MFNRRSLNFWTNWFVVVAELSAIFGLLLAFVPAFGEFFLTRYVSDIAAYQALPANALNLQRFLLGLSGAIMLGWCVLLAAVAHYGLRRGERWAWWGLVLTLVAWFATDSYVSLSTGMYLNALLNVVFLILFALPLAATYGAIVRSDTQVTDTVPAQEVAA